MTLPTTAPQVSRRTILVAGFLDQLVVLGVFLLGFGAGLLRADTGGSGGAIAAGLGLGIVGALVCLVVQGWLAVRLGSTAGLFLRGIRFDPDSPVHWFDDAADWLLFFWRNVVLAPMVWLVDRVSRRRDERGTGFVPDPRARTGGGRLARVLLAVLLIATPLPFVLAVLA